MDNVCVCCGEEIPEGSQVCFKCNAISEDPYAVCHTCKHYTTNVFQRISLVKACNRCIYNPKISDMFEGRDT